MEAEHEEDGGQAGSEATTVLVEGEGDGDMSLNAAGVARVEPAADDEAHGENGREGNEDKEEHGTSSEIHQEGQN